MKKSFTGKHKGRNILIISAVVIAISTVFFFDFDTTEIFASQSGNFQDITMFAKTTEEFTDGTVKETQTKSIFSFFFDDLDTASIIGEGNKELKNIHVGIWFQSQEPNQELTASGKIFVKRNDVELFPNGIQLTVSGVTDENGLIVGKITGEGASEIGRWAMSIKENKPLLKQGLNTFEFSVSDVNIRLNDQDQQFLQKDRKIINIISLLRDDETVITSNISTLFATAPKLNNAISVCSKSDTMFLNEEYIQSQHVPIGEFRVFDPETGSSWLVAGQSDTSIPTPAGFERINCSSVSGLNNNHEYSLVLNDPNAPPVNCSDCETRNDNLTIIKIKTPSTDFNVMYTCNSIFLSDSSPIPSFTKTCAVFEHTQDNITQISDTYQFN